MLSAEVEELEDGTFSDDSRTSAFPSIKDCLREMVTVERFAYTPMGTFGRLRYKGFGCFTVEKPWANNAPYTSCIPTGIYPIKLGKFYHGAYSCYELDQVPNRTLIKIHRGNTMDDVKGCIAVGTALGVINKLWAVTNSRKAHDEFMAAMKENKAERLFINIHNLEVGAWGNPSYATTK
jgi:hypothetical protein